MLIFWTQGYIVFQFLCTKQMVDGKQVEVILKKAVSISILQLFTCTFK